MKVIVLSSIIVKAMYYDGKRYLSVERLKDCVKFCRKRFNELNLSSDFLFPHLSSSSIEGTVYFNNDVFKLDVDGDIIYLQDGISLSDLANEYVVEGVLRRAIKEFCGDNKFFIPPLETLDKDTQKIVEYYTQKARIRTLKQVLTNFVGNLKDWQEDAIVEGIRDIKKSIEEKYEVAE